MSQRIYKVTTPAGIRLVEASTKGQAIKHCVDTNYKAEPILSSELYAAMQAGAKVETAVTEKVSPKEAKAVGDMMAAVASVPTPAQQQAGLLQHGLAPGIAPAANPTASAAPAANQAPANWNPPVAPQTPAPQPPAGLSPAQAIIAEQQRVNPHAAAVAGVPSAIIPPRALAPQPPLVGEGNWDKRAG